MSAPERFGGQVIFLTKNEAAQIALGRQLPIHHPHTEGFIDQIDKIKCVIIEIDAHLPKWSLQLY